MLKLAWIGVVLLVAGEMIYGGLAVYADHHPVPHSVVLFFARAMIVAAVAVSGVAFIAFLFSFTGRRNAMNGTALLIASLVVSFVVIGTNAWA